MTQKATPNPIELYEAAVKATRKVVAGVKTEQVAKQTPCDKWNVQQLVEHMVQANGYLTSFMTGSKPAAAPAKSVIEAYDAATNAALKAIKAPGALEKKGKGPMGDMTGAQMVGMIFSDTLIHGWDLAKATGQAATLDAKLAEASYGMVAPHADGARKAGAFGPAVAVPANASPQDKLLGLTGRKP